MLGQIIVWITFAAGLISTVAYYQTATGKRPSIKLARNSFAFMVAGVLVASLLLMKNILNHQYEYSYVWNYSSNDLPLSLLVTTFWAGQEGSFLLWGLFAALLGLALQGFARRRKIEYETMTVYGVVMVFLLLLIAAKTPFQYLWDAFPGEVTKAGVPADGKGLNPLLQNFWMIIHPPVLFVGFASLAAPFVLAVVGLWKRRYQEWTTLALPWVLFSALALGAGLMLGGYWAYGVLGWGGWWGWDPVENSSLIPWIVAVTLLHTLLVQKKTGKLARTNFVLAIAAFLLVIYSTFLTRSGILGEASVHSFVNPGAFAYTLLVLWLATFTIFGFVVLSRRWKELSAKVQSTGWLTRESFLAVASILLILCAVVVLFGTSLPIFGKSSVEQSFYNGTTLPIAVLLGLLIGTSLLLKWNESSGKELLKKSIFSVGFSLVVCVGLYFLGLQEWRMIPLAFAAVFAFTVNAEQAYRLAKELPRALGGSIAHIGLALLFLGIIGSGWYGEKKTASLTLNESKELMGYRWTYTGSRQMENGKYKFEVKVEKDGSTNILEPVMFESSYNNSLMRNPDYISSLMGDVYLEPVSVEAPQAAEHQHDFHELTKGEPVRIEDMTVTFLRFDMGNHGNQGMTDGKSFGVGAVLEVKRGKTVELVTPTTIYADAKPQEVRTAMLKGTQIGFQMLQMNIDMDTKRSSIQVNVIGLPNSQPVTMSKESLVVEASVKPFMSLVWFGAFFACLGFFVAALRRKGEANGQDVGGSKVQTNVVRKPVVKQELPKEEVTEA
ncbi:MAG: cytochrome c biogenesis protein CcsA [Bacteroidota bacterium]